MNLLPNPKLFVSRIAIVLFLVVGILMVPRTEVLTSQEKAKDQPPENLETHNVTSGTFLIQTSFRGRFVPARATTVSLSPRKWKKFYPEMVVPENEDVEKGDVLINFETDRLEDRIARVRRSIHKLELDLEVARAKRDTLKETIPIKRKRARFRKERAADNLRYFKETKRALLEEDARKDFEQAKENLMYELEELKQLKTMYDQDDITEETEEIVLKRQKNRVKHSRFRKKRQKKQMKRRLNTKIPRKEKRLKWKAQLRSSQLAEKEVELNRRLQKKKIRIENLQTKLRRKRRKLEDLRHDLDLMTVKADRAGTVYFGHFKGGNWQPMHDGVREKLQNGERVNPNKIRISVVEGEKLRVASSVPEKKLYAVRADAPASIDPTGFPGPPLEGTVHQVKHIPDRNGRFRTTVHLKDQNEQLRPGMTCTVETTAHRSEDAVAIPQKFLHNPSDDDPYVRIQTENGQIKKKNVQPGAFDRSRVEITDGLTSGQTIVREK